MSKTQGAREYIQELDSSTLDCKSHDATSKTCNATAMCGVAADYLTSVCYSTKHRQTLLLCLPIVIRQTSELAVSYGCSNSTTDDRISSNLQASH